MIKQMKNVLITGGAGFIGSNFIRFLTRNKSNLNLINLDLLTYAGHLENLADLNYDPYHFIQGDICDFELVSNIIREFAIDTVVHFAAETHVDRSILSPGQFINTNIIGTYNLLENCRLIWKDFGGFEGKKFHHVSTDEVFGMLKIGDPAFTENTPYAPNSPYAASKASSDHIVRSYFHTYKLPVTISNCSNNYGSRQFPEKLIPLMILNAVNGRSLPVYGDGQQIRDWLFVEDHCEAIFTILQSGKLGETYNIGGVNQIPNLEIVKMICSIVDTNLPQSPYLPHEQLITFVQDRPGHDFRYEMNIDKIGSQLGWEPKFDLESGLKSTVKWYLDNQNWIEQVTGNVAFQNWLTNNYENR